MVDINRGGGWGQEQLEQFVQGTCQQTHDYDKLRLNQTGCNRGSKCSELIKMNENQKKADLTTITNKFKRICTKETKVNNQAGKQTKKRNQITKFNSIRNEI